MATFRNYDRLLFGILETAEGTAEAVAASDYLECIEPQFNITNRVYDRDVTRKSISPMLKTVTGSGAESPIPPSAQCEITFGIEVAGTGAFGSGTEANQATEPRWGRLLQACGFVQSTMWRAGLTGITDAGAAARVPKIGRNASWVSNDTSGTAAGSEWNVTYKQGRLLGDHAFDDPYLYLAEVSGTTPAAGAATDKYFTQAADESMTNVTPLLTASSTLVKRGFGWSLCSDDRLGGANDSSLTLQLHLGDTGQYLEAVGCRGNVEFQFTSGDRCIMQFTFIGKLNKYEDVVASPLVPTSMTQAIPPGVVGMSAAIAASGFGTADAAPKTNSVFNDFSLNIGNELTLRENVNDSVGYSSTYITGRSGSMSITPDATPASSTHTPWWNLMLSGDPVRMRTSLGAAAQDDANSFVFKMPALQFEQIGDGDRDTVTTYEVTGSMTGGDNGSSVQFPMDSITSTATGGSEILNGRLGTNNEFTFIYS
jgi:hypothetical protein